MVISFSAPSLLIFNFISSPILWEFFISFSSSIFVIDLPSASTITSPFLRPPFSAAEKSGLKVGDVIIKANGNSISTFDELEKAKNSLKIGDELTLTVNRNGSEIDIKVILQEAP